MLGALHVYKKAGMLNQREVRFCEVVAGFVGSSLSRMRMCRALEAENSRLRMQTVVSDRLVGDSPVILQLRSKIARAAPSNATVLIHGETGVGKELVALALHQQSNRAQGPFVVANCAAVAESLFESEFFGHVRGAFTGAAGARLGFFQQADDGTLFLDEVGEVPLESQATLLRAIEYKTFRAVGAEQESRSDVRIIAATNRDLAQEVERETFRKDLYYRLGVIHIAVPPLREHVEDIPALVEHFLSGMPPPHARSLSPAALAELMAFHWPGNVRQLRAVLESAAIMGQGNVIEPCDLNLHVASAPPPVPRGPRPPSALQLPSWNLEEIESLLIAKVLGQTGDNVSEAARLLGISRDSLHRKIKRNQRGAE
jgi:DNA-binding NtrC family response regulator